MKRLISTQLKRRSFVQMLKAVAGLEEYSFVRDVDLRLKLDCRADIQCAILDP